MDVSACQEGTAGAGEVRPPHADASIEWGPF